MEKRIQKFDDPWTFVYKKLQDNNIISRRK